MPDLKMGNHFYHKFEQLRQKVAALQRRATEDPAQQDTLDDALEELLTAMEEMQVAEEQLRQQNEALVATRHVVDAERQRYQDLFEFAPDGYLVTDPGGTIQEANHAAVSLLNITQDFLLGIPLVALVAESDRQAFVSQLTRLAERERVQDWKLHVQPRDGTPFPAAVTAATVRDREGKLVGLRWLMRDISERVQTEERILTANERLQAVSRRLVEVQEAERRHIARELHDEVGQVLTGLNLLLGMSPHAPADTIETRLGEARALVEELMEKVDELSLDLRPAMLDDLGLLPALLWHFERYATQTGVRVSLEHSGMERRFTTELETALYRVVQEALTNVARHAGVSEVTVRVWADPHALSVQVEDQGAGFDIQADLVARGKGGLSGLYERAALLGGRLTVESVLGTGTCLTAEWPLDGKYPEGAS
jgi:PAS domain S-box-containing protein